WLIGPSGLLNILLPLLSDLAGHTITIKDLIPLLDPEDGPTIVKFIDAIEQLDYISGLVEQAGADAKDGNLLLDFGDLAISNPGNAMDRHQGGGSWHSLAFGGDATQSILGGSGTSLSSLTSLGNISLPSLSG